MEPLQPVDFDRDTGAFFQAARERRLIYRYCTECRRGTHPPAQHCRHCGSARTEWRDAAGTGELFTWSTVTRQVHPGYPVPYTVVVVALSEAPEVRLLGRLDGEPELQAGQRMEVCFEELGNGQVLPQWRPAARTA